VAIALDTVGLSCAYRTQLPLLTLLQKGPEIRTGLMRDNMDVRVDDILLRLLLINSPNRLRSRQDTNSSSPQIPNTVKSVMTRFCGLIMYVLQQNHSDFLF
jgi:hypothetical protein